MISPSPLASSGSSSSPSSSRSASLSSLTAFTSSTTSTPGTAGTADPAAFDPAAAQVAISLGQLEHHIDAAFAAAGELSVGLVQAKRAYNLSSTVGQQAFAALARAHGALVDARGHAVAGHRLLEELGKRLEIRMDDYGDTRKDGDDVPPPGNSSGN